MKNLVLLGSTGSVGRQVLEVVDHLAPHWNIKGLSAHKNIDLLEKQIREYNPEVAAIGSENLAADLKHRLPRGKTEIVYGENSLRELAELKDADLVVNSLLGAAGLSPSVAALKAGNRLGLANKESLVIGGSIMETWIDRDEPNLLPVDSEHNAVFQILNNEKLGDIDKILLTASGGPFLNYSLSDLKEVTVEEALEHPNWNMGNKITIDSATMINKGLEVIEAHWLFNQPYSKIEVVVHPESIIHSLVSFIDNTMAAEMADSDMRITIQNVLTYPERISGIGHPLDLFELEQLNFRRPDLNKFPGLSLAYKAGKAGGTVPAVFNAANEIAVSKFLNKKIAFNHIPRIIEEVLHQHEKITDPDLEHIFECDRRARERAEEVIKDGNYYY